MDTDIAIIGGGIIGLALAYELSKAREVILLEKNARFGEETSSRNSGVIHGTIYYPGTSLKARLCNSGRKKMYVFCQEQNVPCQKIGKYIVAITKEEIPYLEERIQKATEAGAEGLRLITQKELQEKEPYVRGVAALYSPETGIFDVVEFMQRCRALAEQQGAILRKNAKVMGAEERPSSTLLKTTQGELEAGIVINAAGLYADEIASYLGVQETIYPWRGEYYTLKPGKTHMVNSLIYPVPPKVGLGIHFTKTIHGDVHIGPNANPVQRKDDYEENWSPKEEFLDSARKLIPSLEEDDIVKGFSGIRATLVPFDQPGFRDYKIFRKENCVHLLGIESPGLTASLGIAEYVRKML